MATAATSHTVWRIGVDTPAYEAHDLTGKGAETSGGRWNRIGRPMVYCASTLSLAALETAVHLAAASLPMNRFVVRVSIPDEVWSRRATWTASTLPVGWSAVPAGKVSLDLGDQWLADSPCAVLLVPSVVVAEEHNVLINPRHPDAARIQAVKTRPWTFDARLRQ